ncbi:MAG TPA: PLP-dependent transferase [Solirubrobacteraceae bacterium]|nr:PLP-dependent transferase [Solirubrobacteraceae bacterium]
MSTLRPVVGVRPVLLYHLRDVPGAASLPFVAECLLDPLLEAAHALAELEDGTELILLDAHRTQTTQRRVAAEAVSYLTSFRADLSDEERKRLAFELVGDPDGAFPHGTGGAIAVTLARDGRIVDMGTDFGDLGQRSHRDYFDQEAETEHEQQIARDRRTLDKAMVDALFWGHEQLWWHYEYATERWARRRHNASVVRDAQLADVRSAPDVEGPAARPPLVPARYSLWRAGVGHPFLSVEEGAAARDSGGHYYVRHSHPGGDALAEFLAREVLDANEVVLTASGHAAVAHAVRALAEAGADPGGDGERNTKNGRSRQRKAIAPSKLLMANDVYRGSRDIFLKWVDPTDQSAAIEVKIVDRERLLEAIDQTIDIVYVDSPSNWFIKCHDLGALAKAASQAKAKLVVDVTLQPCQRALCSGADLVVCSLSKDVSLGHTMAGAIAGNDPKVLGKIRALMLDWGELITAETAHAIHQHAFSLRDRLFAQTTKVGLVRQALERHSAVDRVQAVDPEMCNGLTGSQLTFQLKEAEQGTMLERIVGQRALDPGACLHLARTFGAVFTTLEHLASREKIASEYRPKINRGTVRLGLGCEPAEQIIGELMFSLDATAVQPNRRQTAVV